MYYIPGIFSIILLPILGIWYINKYDYFTQLRSIDFTFMDFEEAKRFNKEKKANIFFTDELVKRIYKEVSLSNDKNSKNTFNYIDQFVNDVIQTKDTINGLKIHFDEGSTYNDFIEVLNIFNERNAEIYTLDNNTMYFVGRDWDPNAKESEIDYEDLIFYQCSGGYFGGVDETENSNFRSFINSFKNQFNQNKIIYSSYIIFVLLTILSIFIKNKKLPK